MKRNWKVTVTAALALMMLFSMAGCTAAPAEGLWKDAMYTEDAALGEGAKTMAVEIAAGDQSITLTIKTDKETVGDALMEHELISGDVGEFGLYVKNVNGILADYDVDGYYWAFYINGEYAMTGVDMTPIHEGENYRLERAK
ncbi:MAG: DUF4430 domain-containing protein [Clostridiales bacterium]|nr:DUF4430 domain-containing protein [Clostridiales bacterium]